VGRLLPINVGEKFSRVVEKHRSKKKEIRESCIMSESRRGRKKRTDGIPWVRTRKFSRIYKDTIRAGKAGSARGVSHTGGGGGNSEQRAKVSLWVKMEIAICEKSKIGVVAGVPGGSAHCHDTKSLRLWFYRQKKAFWKKAVFRTLTGENRRPGGRQKRLWSTPTKGLAI